MQSSFRILSVFAFATALIAATVVGPGPVVAAQGDCAQPVTNGSGPAASDCLYVLRAGVGSEPCTLCVCDADGSGTRSATDGLICLKAAVGHPVTLGCPPCASTTTVIPGSSTSTSSTSTSSTTTTMLQTCDIDADCVTPGRVCNPNTGNCERPCFSEDDCRLFYECDTSTNLCVDPDDL